MSTFEILARRGNFGLVIMILTLRLVLLSIYVLKITYLWEDLLPSAYYVLVDDAFVEEDVEDDVVLVDPPEEIIDPVD